MPYQINKRMFERAAYELQRLWPHLTTEQAMECGERVVRAACMADQRSEITYSVVIPGQMTVDEVLDDIASPGEGVHND